MAVSGIGKRGERMSDWYGVLPIVQTPFDASGHIDWNDLGREVDWIYSLGCRGLGTGMVSESRSLDRDERSQLAKHLVKLTGSRGQVFIAVTADTCADSERLAVDARDAGCQAIMAAPPLRESLDVEPMVDFYARLHESTGLTVIVQDASGYLGHSIPLKVYLDLLDRFDETKILFKPEAPPNGPNISRLREATQGRARIYEGSGGIYLIDSMRRGVWGTMPGVDLLDGAVAIWNAMKNGDESLAYRLQLPLSAIVSLQMQAGLDGFLEIEKMLLVHRGLFRSAARRPPIEWRLDDETRQEVLRLFELMKKAESP